MKIYAWIFQNKEKTGSLKDFARDRLRGGSMNCTTPANVEFDVEERRRNCFYGIARDTVTGEKVSSH